jgi:cytidylate kinase
MAQRNIQLIGLSGTNGSGKDTVGHMLDQHHHYMFISITDLLRNEARRRGVPIDREHLRGISAEWRRQLGLGVLVDKAVAEYEAVKDKYNGLVIASLRNPGEANRVHELGGTVVWIDADPRARYERVQANAPTRGRAGEDNKTFEQFQMEEAAEMQFSGDTATLNMIGVKERSDIKIDNNDPDLETFRRQLEKALGL